MLTRLKINGFKNLINVDVSFGPFTCIAGVNGVGKSNLFDAITFLSALADCPLTEAARRVRDDRNRATDLRSLFSKVGTGAADEMTFEAEMVVPQEGQDDLGQTARAAITFLRYKLRLRYRNDDEGPSAERLEITEEELQQINVTAARKRLRFPHSAAWLKSAVVGKGRRGIPFISTDHDAPDCRIKFHQEGVQGRPRIYRAATLPRTVLSSANAPESPTALLARLEMRSWRLLQLEPSAMRNSDQFSSPAHVGTDGSHLAATLHRLARSRAGNGTSTDEGGSVYASAARQLSTLLEDVREVRVDEDRQRELLTLEVLERNGNAHAARALSDGTLRFLALAILEVDQEAQRVLCFEEPENGIHPARVDAMLRLLNDLAVDSHEPVGADNPLRQVIVNTHSPTVVGLIDDDDLLMAEPREVIVDGIRCRGVGFSWLSDTWRARAFPEIRTVSRGSLGAYLNPLEVADEVQPASAPQAQEKRHARRRVKDREDLNMLLPIMSRE